MSDAHSAVGSYVADALNPVERAEFEDHLAGCYRCRLEVAEYSETVAMLTPLVATSPPAKLRSSILAAIDKVQPLAAEVTALSEERARLLAEHEQPTELRPAVPATVTELRPLGPDEVTPLEEHPSVLPDSSWVGVTAGLSDEFSVQRSRRSDRILVALVAAALVVALAFSGWIYVSWQQDQTEVTQTQRENEVLTAPDAKVHVSTVDETRVSFVVSKELNKAVFIARDLPDPRGDSIYQLWTIKGQTAKSAGVVSESGSVRQLIEGEVAESDRIAISHEPAPKGSDTPTSILAQVSI